MSLKAVHICFITLSMVLTFGFGYWGIRNYSGSGNLTHLSLGIASLLGGAFLVGYLFWFVSKMRGARP